MGKASRRKKERRALLDQPTVIRTRGTMTPGQRQWLTKWKVYTASLDFPDGPPIEFAPVPTWREWRGMALDYLSDLEERYS